MCAATARAFETSARDQVERVRARSDLAVVHEAQAGVPLGGEQLVGLVGVHRTAEDVRHLAIQVERSVGLEPSPVVAEQKVRRSRARDLLVHRLDLAWLEVACEERGLAVDHETRAHLEDVRRLPDQAGVLHHLRAPATRCDHHLGAGPVARLERSRSEQREITLRGAEERRPEAEERPVEIGVDAPDAHYARTPRVANGGRSTGGSCSRSSRRPSAESRVSTTVTVSRFSSSSRSRAYCE